MYSEKWFGVDVQSSGIIMFSVSGLKFRVLDLGWAELRGVEPQAEGLRDWDKTSRGTGS